MGFVTHDDFSYPGRPGSGVKLWNHRLDRAERSQSTLLEPGAVYVHLGSTYPRKRHHRFHELSRLWHQTSTTRAEHQIEFWATQ